MTISFTMTAGEVVTKAMKELGILSPGSSPTADEMADGVESLDAMLKSWGGKGVTCWTDIDGTATITGGDPDVVLSPRPLFVTEARVVISSTNERLLSSWENDEYARLPNKAAVGAPTIYSLRYTPAEVTMRVWPVPASNMTIKYGYARTIEDAVQNSALDVPQEWLETVYVCLAARLAPGYGNLDPNVYGEVKERAALLMRDLDDFSRPASYIMGAA